MSEDKKQLPQTLALSQGTGLVLNNIEDLQRTARLFLASGMFPEKDAEKDLARACVKIIAGQELGLKPFQAMRGIDIIQGTPSFRYQLVGAKIKQSGRYDFVPVESTREVAKIQFYDRGKPVFLSVFTIKDAVDQGLANKDGYKRMPADMLYARALTKGANKVCPELFYGECYAPEDFGATSGDAIVDAEHPGSAGEVIDAQFEEPKQQGAVATEPPKQKRGARTAATSASTATAQGKPEGVAQTADQASSTPDREVHTSSEEVVDVEPCSDTAADQAENAPPTPTDTPVTQAASTEPAKRVRLY